MAVIPSQDASTVRRLRLGIGVLGIALPFVLVAGEALLTGRFTVLDSISAYHRTGMRDVFVGSLCAIGVFLVCYRYARLDDLLSTVAGALAIAVALLPVAPPGADPTERLVGRAHQVCAAVLFVLLALFCFLFARSSPSRPRLPAEKRGHHGIYRTCGVVILAAIGLALASNALPGPTQDELRPLFWCETVAVLAFGAAWLTKGVAIVKDAARAPGPPVDDPGATREDQPA